MNTLIIMDYNTGFVHCFPTQRKVYDGDWEAIITGLGFNLDEVEWMLTSEQYPFEFHKGIVK